MHDDKPGFVPLVPAAEIQPELTLRAVLLGCALGTVFGVASTYLALRVGITVSASVPIAVLAITILRRRRSQRAILEHNVTQTAGSAGESVAAALVFTVPALVFLGLPLDVSLGTLIALTGGVLGVLMVVPLRRYLIVKEHGVLRYPEGKACAEILAAGERGGTSAHKVLLGMAVGASFKALQAILGAVKLTAGVPLRFLPGASVRCDFEPALLGVGYILGYRTASIMVGGSLLAVFILTPLVMLLGGRLQGALPADPSTLPADLLTWIRQLTDESAVRNEIVKKIGAGAVAGGGIFALLRALPAILSALGAGLRMLTGGVAPAGTLRTDRDAPLPLLLFGALAIVAFLWLWPGFQMSLLGAALILALGFLFSVVSSRITGEVGSTSSPLSGMTIGVLMGTCGLFLLIGRGGATLAPLVLTIGAVICVAISNAGTCSQDLKTGFLVGATPVKQQAALLIGVLTAVPAVGWTAYLLDQAKTVETKAEAPFAVPAARAAHPDGLRWCEAERRTLPFVTLGEADVPAGQPTGSWLYDPASRNTIAHRRDGIGGEVFPAPQARLMAVLIESLLENRLDWTLILLGAAIAVFVELLGFGSLTFAVGVYLPLSATLPVFLGGIVRRVADRRYGRQPDAEDEPEGVQFSSGLIAGAAILAVLATFQGFLEGYNADEGWHPSFALLKDVPNLCDRFVLYGSDLSAFAVVALICLFVFRAAAPRR